MRKPFFEIFFDFFVLDAADPARAPPREKSISIWLFSPAPLSDSSASFVHSSGRFIQRFHVHPPARFIPHSGDILTNFRAHTLPIFVTLHNAFPSILYRLACIPPFCFITLALHSVFVPPSNRLTSGLPCPRPRPAPLPRRARKKEPPLREAPWLIPFCASCAPRTRA